MNFALALKPEEMSIAEALADAVDRLLDSGVASAHLDARLLLAHVLDVGREYLTAHAESLLDHEEQIAYFHLVDRRAAREPLSHILGTREFWSLNFRVTSDTLDPRADSESVIEAVLDYVPTKHARLMVADFGVGTGCLLLSLLSEYPNARGLGVDNNPATLEIAEENASALGLSGRAIFHSSNWGEGVMGRYDVIVSNPPYIPDSEIILLQPEVSRYEPRGALAGGKDGLDEYRRLVPHIKRLLAPQGIAILEFGMGQTEDVVAIAQANMLKLVEVRHDLAGIERCVVLVHDATQEAANQG